MPTVTELYHQTLAARGFREDPAQLAAHFINLANGGLRFLMTDDFASSGFRRDWARGVARLFLVGLAGDNSHM